MIRRPGQDRFIEFRLPGPVQVSDSVPEPKNLSRRAEGQQLERPR
jgi:hypothetical protein